MTCTGPGRPAEQFAAELRADMQDHQHPLGVHQRRDFLVVRDDGHLPEVGRAGEAGDQVARRRAVVLVIDRERNAVQIERGRVAEHQQLISGGHEDAPRGCACP